jgi:hypothetical protein
MSLKRKNCRRSIVNHHVVMRDRKGRFCKSKHVRSRKEKRQSRKEKRQSRKEKRQSRNKSHGKYRGTIGDGCELNYNTLDDTHGFLNPGADDTCYNRCPLTDHTIDELLCENNLSKAAVAANDRLNSDIATKGPGGDAIGEYMFEVPARSAGGSLNYLKLAQLGGSTGLTSTFKPRGNKDLKKNTEKVVELLKQRGAKRRDEKEISVKTILEDYARINPHYKHDIEELIKTL